MLNILYHIIYEIEISKYFRIFSLQSLSLKLKLGLFDGQTNIFDIKHKSDVQGAIEFLRESLSLGHLSVL